MALLASCMPLLELRLLVLYVSTLGQTRAWQRSSKQATGRPIILSDQSITIALLLSLRRSKNYLEIIGMHYLTLFYTRLTGITNHHLFLFVFQLPWIISSSPSSPPLLQKSSPVKHQPIGLSHKQKSLMLMGGRGGGYWLMDGKSFTRTLISANIT